MLPLQIIFFGENEYLEWKKKRPHHSQFNKKNQHKGEIGILLVLSK
jgi:hypothetical protein